MLILDDFVQVDKVGVRLLSFCVYLVVVILTFLLVVYTVVKIEITGK